MSEKKIRTFPDLEELSRAAAEHFAALACQRAQEKGLFSVALSGGKTPQTFLKLLASPELSGRIPWENTRIFQVDERCVPSDHPESNYRMIRELLLAAVPSAAANFHRMKADQQDREAASEEYAQVLEETLAPAKGRAPRFDVIFLGMGPDGHTASLFPGSSALAERSRWVCLNYIEKLQAHRLTLTFPVLNAASEVVFLVSGPDKAEALRQVIEGPRNPEHYPAQGVQPEEGKVTWHVDAAAARLLSAARRSAP
jgi:6-phosphogluconolactonase